MSRIRTLLISITGPLVLILVSTALMLVDPAWVGANDSSTASKSPASSDPSSVSADAPPDEKGGSYDRLLRELEVERRRMREEERRHEEEDAAERKRIDALEREVSDISKSNAHLEQTMTNLQSSNQELVGTTSQYQKQIGAIQKVISSQLGPFNFGDRINAFLGQHTFTMAGDVSTGFYYSRQANLNDPVLEFQVNPMIRLADWLQFYGAFGAVVGPGGISAMSPTLANLQIFPLGQEEPLELLAGLFDMPLGDFYENQGPPWVNPFVTSPLPFGAEAVVPPSSLGLQVRSGIQWGVTGQDFDSTIWADSGPSFESSPGVDKIPGPVIGEQFNPLTGTNIATNGKGIGARFRFYPVPVDWNLGRLELEASTYNGKWLDGLWFNSWDLGYAYRLGPFRTRGEWVQSYRQMPSAAQIPFITGKPAYAGCCGHDNREGWYAMLGYSLYGIPHPYLGDWLEPRFNKLEFLVRYSGVNQRAILENDISAIPVQGFNGSPAIYNPHAREVALGLDYWMAPSIVWQSELDFELPRAGGTLYNLPGNSLPTTVSPIGSTTNDRAIQTQLTIGF